MDETLVEALASAEEHLLAGTTPQVPAEVSAGCDAMFESTTQAFREAAVGCLLTRIYQPEKNIRLPYIKQGADAFNGRTLDERVVNPFLQRNRMPCSKGPYLNVFRRQVTFDESTRPRVRDPKGFDGLLQVISAAQQTRSKEILKCYLIYLLYRFATLREQSQVDLLVMRRISLPQYDRIVRGLLSRPSGGFLPLAIVAAAIEAINETFRLNWKVDYQDINVADAAAGVAGDITIRSNGTTVMVIEVTERPVEAVRLDSTFATKIAGTVADYVFMVHLESIDPEVRKQAERYFAQGHEVNFVDIAEWVRNTLASLASGGRAVFQQRIVSLLSASKVPRLVKLAWNEEIKKAVSS